ncbi:syntaxin-10 isoform X1 [Salmo trutta]|uniref:syntaxin-10 isoform X1 n=1 Tax=Salmo trutta TaxID=8032 RepID=UPI00113078C4|nr:syntaxin-10-like isoform X1 [Salmo trutta]
MSLEDPFFVVKGEVQKALSRARSLYERWEELLEEGTQVSKDELDWSTNELRNCLRAIDWDLEDLSETISIVESNPGKFRLGENELQERRDFVERTRQAVQEMKDQLSSPSVVAQAEKKNRQALMGTSGQDRSDGLESHLVSANSRYIQDQQEQQQLIMQDQDEQLELVTGSIRVLKDMSGRIGDELDQQAVMLGEFGEEMDQTGSRMNSVLKKMEKVSHMTSSRRQWCAIGVLVILMCVCVCSLRYETVVCHRSTGDFDVCVCSLR